MRGAPQVGFSAAIRKIRARTSLLTCLRPPARLALETHVQYKRNPARCQLTTVLGVTKTRGFVHPDQNVFNATATNMVGCLKWQSGIMLVNLALHNTEDWTANFDLFIHEMAHADGHNNDRLAHKFYNTVSEVGAKLAQLAIERPGLFKEQKGVAAGK